MSPLALDQKCCTHFILYKIRTSRQFIQVQNLKVIITKATQVNSKLLLFVPSCWRCLINMNVAVACIAVNQRVVNEGYKGDP